jgi:DNA polymerase-3 subunit epsilon
MVPPDLPLLDLPCAVVDVETTGTSPDGGDRVTEIAIVPVQGGVVGEPFTRLVDPERSIPPVITALTGITPAMVRGQPPFRAIAGEVASRLAGRVFVAHNASFDWRFVQGELARAATDGLPPAGAEPRLCTVRLARVFLPRLPRRSLDHVAAHFGIPLAARHRAAGDAMATAQALVQLLALAHEAGIAHWGGLVRHLATPARRRRTQVTGLPTPRTFPLS